MNRCWLVALLSPAMLAGCAGLSGMGPGGASPNARLICVDPLVKVFRTDTNLPVAAPVAHAAVGEYATLQFIFRPTTPVTDLQARISIAMTGTTARFVGYVNVGKRRCEELWPPEGKQFPDPLLEDARISVDAGRNQPVWITIPTTRPGRYKGTLTLSWTGGQIRQAFTTEVHNVRMKKPRLWITNWWFSDEQRLSRLAGHKVISFSEEYWTLIRQIADFMAAYRQNVVLVSPLDLVRLSQTNGSWQFDFSRFDRTVEIFLAAGVAERIEGGHIGGRSGEWNSPFHVRAAIWTNGAARWVNLFVTNTAARAFYAEFFPALQRHLDEKGWTARYRQHLGDEPVPTNSPSYRDMAGLIRTYAPRLKVIEATQSRELIGCVDTWVPILDHLHRDYEFMRARQAAGDEVWTYTCCGPGAPYANRFIEQALIKPRLLHWINFRYGVTGYLHWGFNYWDPKLSPFEETTFTWPAGDQWIVYPKDGRLLSSIRLEAMRDGIADHELLSMLSERDPALAKRLAEETIPDFNRYDTDIARFRARRLELLRALER